MTTRARPSKLILGDISGLTSALANLQPKDADLDAIAALSTQAFGRNLLTLADQPSLLTRVGLDQVSVKAYGALGDGATDDTSAIATAYAVAAAANRILYFPPGVYLATALPDFADRTRIVGAGGAKSFIYYAGTGTLRTLTNKYGIQFSDIGFFAASAGATLLTLSNSFRTSFERVIFRGQHGSTSATYRTQVGLNLINNSGASNIIDCDFENLGIGLRTTAIQNEMTGGKFTSCWVSVQGVGGTASAGGYFVNTEFIGSATNGVTDTHVLIDGTADSWSFLNVWMEKCQYALKVGVAGTGGPAQFSFIGGKIAGSVVGLQLNHCRQAYLAATKFDVDDFGTGTDVVINGTYCPEGTALNLVSITRSDFQDADFPQYWTIARKGSFRAGNILASNVQVNGQITLNNAPSASTDGANKQYADATALAATITERTATRTLSNARMTRRAVVVTQSATPAINTDTTDVAIITGLAQNITSMTSGLTGTPVQGDFLQVEIVDNGTSRSITWGAKFESSGIALPTYTLGTIRQIVQFVWNATSSKWSCVGLYGFTALVDISSTQTLSGKTLTSPQINSPTISGPVISGYNSSSTVSSATTLVLANGSAFLQQITGTAAQVVTLPTTTIGIGKQFLIDNQSTGAVTVNASGGTLVATLPSGAVALVTARVATPTTNAHWAVQLDYSAASQATTAALAAGAATVSFLPISAATPLLALANNHYYVLMSSGGIPTLPTAVGNASIYTLKNMSGGSITPATTGSQNIEGAAPTAMANGVSWTLVSDQTGWRIV